jgi:hypothetical protein
LVFFAYPLEPIIIAECFELALIGWSRTQSPGFALAAGLFPASNSACPQSVQGVVLIAEGIPQSPTESMPPYALDRNIGRVARGPRSRT